MPKPNKHCAACGERIDPTRPLPESVGNASDRKELWKAITVYCDECAAEKVLGRMIPGTTINGTGGGQRVIRDPRGLA